MKKPKKTKAIVTSYFKEKIKKIFGIHHFVSYRENPFQRTLSFDYGQNGVSFDQLQQLSELTQSKKINFTGDTITNVYSEVSYDTETKGKIFVEDVVFPCSLVIV